MTQPLGPARFLASYTHSVPDLPPPPTTTTRALAGMEVVAQARNGREAVQAIAELTPKHRLAITRAYKVWTIPSMADAIAAYGVTDRTWGNWAHEAGRELARKLERQAKKVRETA